MKKTLLSFAIVTLSTTCSAFAAAPCPSVADIHRVGSIINTAYQSPPDRWIFSTEGFAFNKQLWQTTFKERLPGVVDPYKAIQIAQQELATLNMLSVPKVRMIGDVTVCNYTPQGVTYEISVANTVI
jgi:hypothetical protein